MKLRLFHKFLLLILISTLIPLIWLGINLIERSQFSIKTPISELHLNNTENIKNKIETALVKYDELTLLIDSYFSQVFDWMQRQYFLNSLINTHTEILSISLLDKNLSEVIKISQDKKDNKLNDYSKFPYAGKIKSSIRYFISSDNKITVFYNRKNYYIKFEIAKALFFQTLNIQKFGEKTKIFIITEDKRLLLSINLSENEKKEILNIPIINQALKNLSSAITEYSYKGKNYIGAYSYIQELNAAVISVQEEKDAYNYAMSIKKDAVRIIIIFATIVILISYLLSKNLTKPIFEFIKAAQRISNQDFNVEVKINTNDELQELATAFNNMVKQLKKYSELQIEKILREQQNTQAIMFSTEDGIIMVDNDFNIQLINRKAKNILNIKENPENKNVFSVVNDDFKEALNNALNSDKKQSEYEISTQTYHRYYKILITEITHPTRKEKIGNLITLYDITLDKELERIKDEFLHSITHDLRNPVSAIKGFSEFLMKEIAGPLNKAQKNMIVSIDRAAFRLLQMVNNILDIAKMEAGKMQLNYSKFNLNELVQRCVDLMQSLAQKKLIKFVIDANEEIELEADSGLIERIFINLIGNAIKFTPTNGTITVGLRKENGKLKAWVEDTGPGIPPEYIDRIFDKFEQVKGQKAGGTGLGLTISKHIAEAHGGRIWAEYRENKGAKFVFEIPLSPKDKSEGN